MCYVRNGQEPQTRSMKSDTRGHLDVREAQVEDLTTKLAAGSSNVTPGWTQKGHRFLFFMRLHVGGNPLT